LKSKHILQLDPYQRGSDVTYRSVQLYDEDLRRALNDDKTRGSFGLNNMLLEAELPSPTGLEFKKGQEMLYLDL
jgi:hypothetical protein